MGDVINFKEFGIEFQQQLVAEVIVDTRFGTRIIGVLDSGYFSDRSLFFIVKVIKNYYAKHGTLYTNFRDLRVDCNISRPKEEVDHMAIMDTINTLETTNFTNLNVQEEAIRFCRFRAVASTYSKHQKKLLSPRVDEDMYKSFMDDLNDAMMAADISPPVSVFDNMEQVLVEDFRDPIPTGIEGIDGITKGGISAGDVALVIAPLGVGKTTFLTSVANYAFQEHKNVLQIFFEDQEDAVKLKHYTIFADTKIDNIYNIPEEVARKSREREALSDGNLVIKKMASTGVTITDIRTIVKQETSRGRKPDLLVVDYIDLIELEYDGRRSSDEWGDEGKIMRKLEDLATDFDIAVWTATQAGRSAINADNVGTEKMGGSIKKAQFAHFICTIAKIPEQKEMGTATVRIEKNRFGPDGILYDNCTFDNSRLIINTEGTTTITEHTRKKAKEKQSKYNSKYDEILREANKEEA